MPQNYDETMNLPKTTFPMRANLPKREPEFLAAEEKIGLYDAILQKNEGKPLFVLHDGPPYANGDIHMGTAMNKILKDIIVRYHNMAGFKAPYVPGWDTHGLPIELKARKSAGAEKAAKMSVTELRGLCRDFALQYVNAQRRQFMRLGVMGEWDTPYLTLRPEYEARQIEVFGEMARKGYIYRGLKPVYWCADCHTALAEAEIEYEEDPCESIYVKFPVIDDGSAAAKRLFQRGAEPGKTFVVIWTTTAWTLPGNVAICLGPDFTYNVVRHGDEYDIIAAALTDSTMAAAGITAYEVVGQLTGRELEYLKASHPLLERESLVILGGHVTLESGTGCVHTAPGHGLEDFEACRNYEGLPIVVPVDANGKMTEEAGAFAGLPVQKASVAIIDALRASGFLFASVKILHQYPHCWRCHEPVIYRATEQWFCSIDGFKEDALRAITDVKWYPGWGEERMSTMVRDRSDWCISRQRIWGVPIPIFLCEDCGEALIDAAAITSVADAFRKEGSDAWYLKTAEELLPAGCVCPHCGGAHFTKGTDIMDVWFDSGSSHAAVCEEWPQLHWPADVYLEGFDQFRGWFQSSLLTSVATKGRAPYNAVITHGMVLDGEGRKMSKSLGNTVAPEDVTEQYGADVLRLWVSSCDYQSDVHLAKDTLRQLSDVYRKIRNTARFILSNLYDFDPAKDSVPLADLESIDRFALVQCNDMIARAREGYDTFVFHQAFHALHNFCVVDLSNFYLDVLKDRLYAEKADSLSRRAAQTALYLILNAMARIAAPILCFTANEIWQALPPDGGYDRRHVMLNDFPAPINIPEDPEFRARWEQAVLTRAEVQKALEQARAEKRIGSSLEAGVEFFAEGEWLTFLRAFAGAWPAILIVSHVDVFPSEEAPDDVENTALPFRIRVTAAPGKKCERCWSYSETVGDSVEHPTLCARCAAILQK